MRRLALPATLLLAALAACSDDSTGTTGNQLTCPDGKTLDISSAPACKAVADKITACCADATTGKQKAAEVVCGMSGLEQACSAGAVAADPACAALKVRPECTKGAPEAGIRQDQGTPRSDKTGSSGAHGGSCSSSTSSSGVKQCKEFFGSVYLSASAKETNKANCSHWSDDDCDRTGAQGYCAQQEGNAYETRMFYYAYTESMLKAAKDGCGKVSGNVWYDLP